MLKLNLRETLPCVKQMKQLFVLFFLLLFHKPNWLSHSLPFGSGIGSRYECWRYCLAIPNHLLVPLQTGTREPLPDFRLIRSAGWGPQPAFHPIPALATGGQGPDCEHVYANAAVAQSDCM